MHKQPEIEVGISLCGPLSFLLHNEFYQNGEVIPAGAYSAINQDNQVVINSESGKKLTASSFLFLPSVSYSISSFELKNVTIGIGFHWEQKENQCFRGKLRLLPEGGKVRAVNVIRLEEYLKSVISSEMNSASSPALLKTHAVISRSWLMAQLEKTKTIKSGGSLYRTSYETEEEVNRWYDREDHVNFDVCADDHCQRYQGITKIHTQIAADAVDQTSGEVIFYKEKICDARFSKCCGGITENFENVWEPVRHQYLTKVVDSEFKDSTCVDLRMADEAEHWIRNSPDAFCNTSDKNILSQVLPGYDQKTADFYRWKKSYSQNELASILKKRSGIDFGWIINLKPLQRGHSGRIIKLKICGTRKELIVGKELEIRKWLSESHLYSSAFVIDHLDYQNGIPQKIVLSGAGWGHGVGLCQIGAAVMGEKGYSYREILNHYFQGAGIKKVYET